MKFHACFTALGTKTRLKQILIICMLHIFHCGAIAPSPDIVGAYGYENYWK